MYGEDPTVQRLQKDAAAMTGKEAALFVSSGTLGNLSAILAHCSERGSEVRRCLTHCVPWDSSICVSCTRYSQVPLPLVVLWQVICGSESHV